MQIAVLGYGVVGSGVAELLELNHELIAKRTGEDISIKYLLDRKRIDPLPAGTRQAADIAEILGDSEVVLVVEAMGGINPAFDYVASALRAKKSVVTSNKELIAEKGAELLELAAENGVHLLFEASVAGGTPVLHPIYQCLAANRVMLVAGILNGTTNFILTKMFGENMGFEQALELAQQLGYAEADPTADVEGIDACRKVCVLASMIFGDHVYPKDVHTEGITKITDRDVAYADKAGYAIKLIGQVREAQDGKILALVTPALVSRDIPLSAANDVFNAVMVRGNGVGDVMFYGRGAGKLPTASAVLSDIIEIAGGGPRGLISWGKSDESRLANYLDCSTRAYVRLLGADIKTVRALLGDVQQLQPQADELAVITPAMAERDLIAALERLKANGATIHPYIRVFDC